MDSGNFIDSLAASESNETLWDNFRDAYEASQFPSRAASEGFQDAGASVQAGFEPGTVDSMNMQIDGQGTSRPAEDPVQDPTNIGEQGNNDIEDTDGNMDGEAFSGMVEDEDCPTFEEAQARAMVVEEKSPKQKKGAGEDNSSSGGTDLVDLAEKSMEAVEAGGHVGLKRPRYEIFRPGSESPGDVEVAPKTRPPLDGENSPYKNWPLFNQFSEIVKKDQSSYPPKNVILQDWHIWKVIDAGIAKAMCHQRWPADFNNTGMPFTKRKPKGRPAKVQGADTGVWRYVIVHGSTVPAYQLCGDEGIPKPTEAEGHDESGSRWSHGAVCLIQDDYTPSDKELTEGIRKTRFPANSIPTPGTGSSRAPEKRRNTALKTRAEDKTKSGTKKQISDSATTTTTTTTCPRSSKTSKPAPRARMGGVSSTTDEHKTPSSDSNASKKRMKDISNGSVKASKTTEATSAGATKRAIGSTDVDISSESEAEKGNDTIIVASPPKVVEKKKSNKKMSDSTKASSPHVSSIGGGKVLGSPAKIGTVGSTKKDSKEAGTSTTASPGSLPATSPPNQSTSRSSNATAGVQVRVPKVTLASRRALQNVDQPDNSAFWAAETANMYHTMQDGTTFMARGLDSVLASLKEACETDDVNESEELLAAVMGRAQQLRAGFVNYTIVAGGKLQSRAKEEGAPELKGLVRSLNEYKKPEIGGSEDIQEKMELPEHREPKYGVFKTSGTASANKPQREMNSALKAALARLHDDSHDVNS